MHRRSASSSVLVQLQNNSLFFGKIRKEFRQSFGKNYRGMCLLPGQCHRKAHCGSDIRLIQSDLVIGGTFWDATRKKTRDPFCLWCKWTGTRNNLFSNIKLHQLYWECWNLCSNTRCRISSSSSLGGCDDTLSFSVLVSFPNIFYYTKHPL